MTNDAGSIADPSTLNPEIWLDGMDIDGDGAINDNPPLGVFIANGNWKNKGTLGAA